jgi:hypothetical protein
MRSFISIALLLLTGAPLAACNSEAPSCNDCGPCGWGGPADSTSIDWGGAGVDAAGVAAVDLQVQTGMCRGDSVARFRVSYDAGSVTVAAADQLPALDASVISPDGPVFGWTDRDLTLETENSRNTLLLTFTDTAGSVRVSCSVTDEVITCQSQ